MSFSTTFFVFPNIYSHPVYTRSSFPSPIPPASFCGRPQARQRQQVRQGGRASRLVFLACGDTASGLLYLSTDHVVSRIWNQVLGTRYLAPDMLSGTKYWVPSTWHQALFRVVASRLVAPACAVTCGRSSERGGLAKTKRASYI